MELEKLSFKIYEKYCDTIERYMDLVPCEQREKVNTATVHTMYAIQDINNQIDKYSLEKLDISLYYQMMIKTDFLVTFIETLYKTFNFTEKKDLIWGEDYKTIQKFRLYRSLTLAHPLETTRYKDFGFGQENNKWCEDIHVKGRMENATYPQLNKADFVMEIIEKGNSFSTKFPIYIREDILSTAVSALKHLSIFTEKVVSKLAVVTENLKNTPIRLNKDMDITDYVYTLLVEVEKRYPYEIEKVAYDNNTEEKHSILLKALERLNYIFVNPRCEEIYKVYKEGIQQAIYEYGSSVQNMNLEETKANEMLSIILYPNTTALCNKSHIEQVDYKCEKIFRYLSHSNERSVETAKEKLEKFSYDGCRCGKVCTNAEWGVIQLLMLQNELVPYFPIDLNATDKELFFQFCTALYCLNQSLL